jgi:hypothetical protein
MRYARRIVDLPDAPTRVEFVRVEDLDRGDRILVYPDEQVRVHGRFQRVDVSLAEVSDRIAVEAPEGEARASVADEFGERRRAEVDARVAPDDTIRDSVVVVEVGTRELGPWIQSAAGSVAQSALYGTAVRPALVVGLVVFALAGTGFGGFNPVDSYARGSPSFGGVMDGGGADDAPPAPPVEATPPEPPGTTDSPATTTPPATTERPPDEPDGPDGPPEDPPSETPTTTAAPSTGNGSGNQSTSTTTTTTQAGGGNAGGNPNAGGGGGNAGAGGAGEASTLEMSAGDVGEIRQPDGDVPSVSTTLDGNVTVAGGADSVVVVVQAWVPGYGWAEVKRANATATGRLSLAALLGEVTLADGERASAFDNPTDGTTVEFTGRVSVTAVFFDGSEEVGREEATDDYRVRVTNTNENTGPLELGSDNDSSTTDLFGPGGLVNGSDGGDGGGDTGSDSGVVVPGSNGSNTIPVTNRGDEPGTLSLTDLSYESYENGLTGPEAEVDSTGGDPGKGAGELHEALELRVALERSDGSQTWVLGNETNYRSVEALANQTVELGTLAAGERVELVVEYRVPESTGNEIQSDTIVVDVSFTLVGTDD